MFHIHFLNVAKCTLHKKWSFPLRISSRIRRKIRISSHLLNNSLIENFIFCALVLAYFWPMFLFHFPWKHQKTIGVFRWGKMETLTVDGLKKPAGDFHNIFEALESSSLYSEPCQTSKTELFAKIVKGWRPLSIFSQSFILDVW